MDFKEKLEGIVKLIYIIFLVVIVFNNYLFFIFIAIHELSHLACGILLGYKVKKISLLPYGFSLCFKEVFIKPRDNIIISIFGPLINLIFFAIFYLGHFIFPISELKVLYEINFMLLIFNLIPIGFLDGGRIAKEIISMYFSFNASIIVINLNGIIFGCIMFMFAFYTATIASKVVFILISFGIIVEGIINFKLRKIHVINKILYKRFRKNYKNIFTKKKYFEENTKIFDIIKNFSFNIGYNIICKNRNIVFEDKEIINIYLTKGNITLKQCVKEK